MSEARFLPTPAQAQTGSAAGLFAGRLAGVGQPGVSQPVFCVYGAPGTGKTNALSALHQQLVLECGLKPEQILVLAATRESAAVLRDRLLLELGRAAFAGSEADQVDPRVSDPAYAVEGPLARTISSLAFAVVRHHALANDQREPELISGAQQDAIFLELLQAHEQSEAAELWPSHISSLTRGLAGFRAELRDMISACQELAVDAAELARLGANRPEWRAAAAVFADYEALLASPDFGHRFDAPSLVNRAIELLAEGDNPLGYRFVLVDDAQELTPSAARLLSNLTIGGAGMAIFGDPDASTLGFRQADPRLMTDLAGQVAKARGLEAAAINIESDPWGKPAGLAKAMRRVSGLISAEGAGRQRVVHAKDAELAPDSPEELSVKVFTSQQDEIDWLAFTLRTLHLQAKVDWQDIAVVARTRQQLDALERSLAAESVPVRIVGAQHALRDEFASRELLELAALCQLGTPVDAAAAERLLRSPFCGLDSVSLRRLRRQLRRQELDGIAEGAMGRNSDELLIELFETPGAAATLRGSDGVRVRKFLKSLQAAKEVAADSESTIEDLLWHLWNDSGLEQQWSELSRGIGEVATQANRNLDAIVALFGAANRFVERNPGADKSQFLIAQLEQKLPEDTLAFGRRAEQYVNLLTPAGLVGRRFHTVVTPQLIEGIWPNLKPRNSLLNAGLLLASVTGRLSESGAPVRAEMTDELRMFYKALGAANKRVIVSSYVSEEEQISQFIGQVTGSGIPAEESFELSSFTLRGLAGDLRRKLASETNPVKIVGYAGELGRLAAAGVPGAHPDQWYGLAEASTTEPLFEFISELTSGQDPELAYDRGAHISLNPSQLEAFLKCPLHWFLNYHGGSQSDFSASLGTLIHRAMELSTALDEASLWAEVESGWHTLKFESAWLEQAERRRAQKAIANLSQYLSAFKADGGRVLAAEQEFELQLGRANIRGKVDRIELTPEGQVVIVDLKTGSTIPSVAEGEDNAQLGLYQLAYQHGAFRAVEPKNGADLGGAKLLLVGNGNTTIRNQSSIEQSPALQAKFEQLVAEAAEGMAMPERYFLANVSSHCSNDNEFGTCELHLRKAVSYVG
jgi:superfamily I DNA/RNA helicase/RecB family exonuclease